jgi:hypothetical protein
MRAWTSLSAIAVHHGWAKEPSDNTGGIISYTMSYIIYDIVYDITFGKSKKRYRIRYCIRYCTRYYYHSTYDLSLSVWQAVGNVGRKRGQQDINIPLSKPARFAVVPLYSIPPSMSANVVQDGSLDPGEEYITYAYRTSHQVLRWLPTKSAEWIGANLCEELNIPDKESPLWIAEELNAIITGNLVGGPYAWTSAS